jgi:hypothetical protein
MSNQRAGKTHRAALGDGMQDMKIRNFFRDAADILNTSGEEDAAFFFEQVTDYINSGKSLPSSRAEVARALGV